MLFSNILPASLVAFVGLTLAQSTTPSITTGATPEQSSVFLAALSSYYNSFEKSPTFSSLGLDLVIDLPASVLSSIEANPTALLSPEGTSLDLYSLATNPPLSFPTEAWETGLNTILQSQLRAAQTSAAVEVAELAQSALSITQSISVPTAATTDEGNQAPKETGMAKALGAAAVAIGAAAVLL